MTNLWVNIEDLGDYAESDYAYEAVKTSSYLLWAMSGRKFSGITTVTERYVSAFYPYFLTGGASPRYWPVLINGSVSNIPVGGNNRIYGNDYLGDGTSSRSRVRLRGRKVIEIHAVRDIDGNLIDPKNYYLADHSILYGTPGSNWNPSNVEIAYSYGSPPPTMGKAAARILAIELVKLYEGDDTCALPQRVTSVTRQGVSYTILDNQSFIDELKTGIYAVDLFLKTANPDKARARSRVFSPDVPRARRIQGKEPLYPLSGADIYVAADGGSVTLYLDEIGGEFLVGDPDWTLEATLSNWYDDKTATATAAPTLNETNGTITVNVTYQEAVSVLGAKDPGTLDITASRPSLGNPEIPEIVNLSTGNAIIRLGKTVSPIYTA